MALRTHHLHLHLNSIDGTCPLRDLHVFHVAPLTTPVKCKLNYSRASPIRRNIYGEFWYTLGQCAGAMGEKVKAVLFRPRLTRMNNSHCISPFLPVLANRIGSLYEILFVILYFSVV